MERGQTGGSCGAGGGGGGGSGWMKGFCCSVSGGKARSLWPVGEMTYWCLWCRRRLWWWWCKGQEGVLLHGLFDRARRQIDWCGDRGVCGGSFPCDSILYRDIPRKY